MSNLNKVLLMGNLTRDPELKQTAGGTEVTTFCMAINRKWEDKQETCFVEVTAFGKRGQVINQYFSKGDPIFIEGRLQFSQWETKEGQKRNSLKVIMENFQFIGGKKDKQETNQEEDFNNPEELPF